MKIKSEEEEVSSVQVTQHTSVSLNIYKKFKVLKV